MPEQIYLLAVDVRRRTANERSAAKTWESNRATRSPSATAASPPRAVSRPRRSEGPMRWPVPCARRDRHHQTVARWSTAEPALLLPASQTCPEEPAPAGREGALPGLINDHPAFRHALFRRDLQLHVLLDGIDVRRKMGTAAFNAIQERIGFTAVRQPTCSQLIYLWPRLHINCPEIGRTSRTRLLILVYL